MGDEVGAIPSRLLFVTGRLAEFALRRELDDLASRAGFTAEVAVLPISVAALMSPRWYTIRTTASQDHGASNALWMA